MDRFYADLHMFFLHISKFTSEELFFVNLTILIVFVIGLAETVTRLGVATCQLDNSKLLFFQDDRLNFLR